MTKVLIPLLSAAALAVVPVLAFGAQAPRTPRAASASSCPIKVRYDPLSDAITPASRYIQLRPHRVDHISPRNNSVTTSYHWSWKPLNGARICEFSYSQNGVLKHPKIVRDPNGGTYSVEFPWKRGVGEEHVFVTARL